MQSVCLSVCLFVCLCVPRQAMEANKNGDYELATVYGMQAKKWNVVAVIISSILLVSSAICVGVWLSFYLSLD